jgi:hypothetical protein
MLDILTQKYQSAVAQDIWNYNDSNDPAVLVCPSKDIVIEWTDSGYFEVKKDKITFNDCVNGHTYSLRKDETRSYRRDSSREDWRKFQELFIDASNTKLFRIDAPIFREEITIDNNDWEYTKIARPGASIGKIYNQHFMDPGTIEQFMEDIIDPYYYVIAGAIKVANNTPSLPGFPRGAPSSGRLRRCSSCAHPWTGNWLAALAARSCMGSNRLNALGTGYWLCGCRCTAALDSCRL